MFTEAAIDAASDQSCGGPDDLARASAQQHGQGDFRMRFVRVGDEPAHARSGVVAGSGFAEGHFVPVVIEAALTGAVENGGEHTFTDFRKNGGDIKIALHTRRENMNFIRSARILQIVESATICECSGERY